MVEEGKGKRKERVPEPDPRSLSAERIPVETALRERVSARHMAGIKVAPR